MTKVVYAGIIIYILVHLTQCQPAGESNQSIINARKLIGNWSSSIVSYPNDPIFKNTPSNTTPGSAKLQFQRDGRFLFSWGDTNATGNYHVDGNIIVLTSKKDGETTKCVFDLTEKRLTIKMDDGFKFEFVRNQ